MRHAFVLLATLTLVSLNACTWHPIQFRGTIMAADDGSPIVNADVEVWTLP
jgi:hypothetical protein